MISDVLGLRVFGSGFGVPGSGFFGFGLCKTSFTFDGPEAVDLWSKYSVDEKIRPFRV